MYRAAQVTPLPVDPVQVSFVSLVVTRRLFFELTFHC